MGWRGWQHPGALVITLADYWMGRDKTHGSELTAEIHRSAEMTVAKANMLLTQFRMATHDDEQRHVTSGWRPAAVNAAIPNAAPRSKHLTAHAIDIADPEGDLDDWCMSESGIAALIRIGLWLEHPSSTKGWCHVQTLPPKSGRRVFYP